MKDSYRSLEAVLHNALLLHFDTWDFDIAGTSCSLSYFPDCPDFEPAISTQLSALEENIHLDFSSLYPLNLHPDIQDLGIYNQLPKALQQVILEFIFEEPLKQISQLSYLPISFLKDPSENKPDSCFYFQLTIGEEFVPIKIYFGLGLVKFVITKLLTLPAKAQDLSQLEIQCLFIVGQMFLTLGEIKELELGDVLLPASLSHLAEEKKVYLQFLKNTEREKSNFSFICLLEDSNLTIIGQYQIQEEQPEAQPAENEGSQEENMSEESSSLNLQDLDLMLSFELERRKMTLAEIEDLQVGTNIILASDPYAPVTINVLNNPFAKARIVDIDGSFALQITEIYLKKD